VGVLHDQSVGADNFRVCGHSLAGGCVNPTLDLEEKNIAKEIIMSARVVSEKGLGACGVWLHRVLHHSFHLTFAYLCVIFM